MVTPGPIDVKAITALLEDALHATESEDGQLVPPAFPGAVWAVGDADRTLECGELGVLDPARPDVPMERTTLFDLASLTKIIAVWALIGNLYDAGALDLDDRLDDHLKESIGYPLGAVTVRQLLTHTAGVPAHASLLPLYKSTDPDVIRRRVLQEQLDPELIGKVQYTDRAALILGYLAEELTGLPHQLDVAATELIWRPLKMTRTKFGPLPRWQVDSCAPTELDPETGQYVRGSVHDYSARLLNGVCGAAGAFSPTADLGIFARHILAPDRTPGVFSADWIKLSLQIQTGDLEPARGLSWYPVPDTTPPDEIWVHLGFTGGSLWVSPAQGRWAALLTNSLYYGRRLPRMTELRAAFRAVAFA